jgi:hypothetical protein
MVRTDPLYEAVRGSMNEFLHLHLPAIVTAKNLTFWATGLFFTWFLLHIRPDQQNNVALATRLAEFDSARTSKPSI